MLWRMGFVEDCGLVKVFGPLRKLNLDNLVYFDKVPVFGTDIYCK